MPMAGQKWMKSKGLFYKVWDHFGPILFPLRCPVCDEILAPEEVEFGIHEKCRNKIYLIQGVTCMHCGRSLESVEWIMQKRGTHLIGERTEEYCLECQRKGYVRNSLYVSSAKKPQIYKQNISHIVQGKALYLYRGEIKKTMYRFKYGNRRTYASYFAKESIKMYGDWIKQKKIQVIIPVPMFIRKQKCRGYNQAECFGRELARWSGIPLETGLIQRVKDTTPQKELNDIERKNNLENAFQIKKSIVQYSHILVVDDIYTTGSTAEAVAKELFQKGVRQVFVLSICIGGDV